MNENNMIKGIENIQLALDEIQKELNNIKENLLSADMNLNKAEANFLGGLKENDTQYFGDMKTPIEIKDEFNIEDASDTEPQIKNDTISTPSNFNFGTDSFSSMDNVKSSLVDIDSIMTQVPKNTVSTDLNNNVFLNNEQGLVAKDTSNNEPEKKEPKVTKLPDFNPYDAQFDIVDPSKQNTVNNAPKKKSNVDYGFNTFDNITFDFVNPAANPQNKPAQQPIQSNIEKM